jgi:hypothetical protein
MKTKKNGRKLVLNKKTIVDLPEAEISVPRGGAASDHCTEHTPRCMGMTRKDCCSINLTDPYLCQTQAVSYCAQCTMWTKDANPDCN